MSSQSSTDRLDTGISGFNEILLGGLPPGQMYLVEGEPGTDADTVVLLRYFELAGEIRQVVSVLKQRLGAHEHTLREFRLGSAGGAHSFWGPSGRTADSSASFPRIFRRVRWRWRTSCALLRRMAHRWHCRDQDRPCATLFLPRIQQFQPDILHIACITGYESQPMNDCSCSQKGVDNRPWPLGR
jgi:hypothetical protein